MKNLPAFTLFLFLFTLGMPRVASGQEADEFKVAAVDIQRVFREFYKTNQTELEINEERTRIQKADRQIRAKLKVMDKQLADYDAAWRTTATTEDEKVAHAAKMNQLVNERNKLNNERLTRYKSSNSQLNRDMMETMKGILGEIQRFVESHSEKSGYDVVFDLSGTSSNQIPPVFGGKGMIAITATVIAELNKEAQQ